MTKRQRAMRLFALTVCFLGSFGSSNGTAQSVSCPKAVCVALPFVSVAHPLQVIGYFRFRDRMAFEHIKGEVINRSDKPYYGGFVRISEEAGRGSTISQTTSLASGVTLPGRLELV